MARMFAPEAIARAEVGEREQSEQAAQERRNRVFTAARAFWVERGRRYKGCSFDNYLADTIEQRHVIARLKKYAAELDRMLELGTGIVLLGPAGTGKDHLLAALAAHALAAGLSVKWTSGAKLWCRFRDNIGSDRSESGVISEYVQPQILILSDPVPVIGDLSPFQCATLYQIVDARYNDCKPIWAAFNASDAQEVERAIGVPILDRLRDGAVSLACNWRSFRRALK